MRSRDDDYSSTFFFCELTYFCTCNCDYSTHSLTINPALACLVFFTSMHVVSRFFFRRLVSLSCFQLSGGCCCYDSSYFLQYNYDYDYLQSVARKEAYQHNNIEKEKPCPHILIPLHSNRERFHFPKKELTLFLAPFRKF